MAYRFFKLLHLLGLTAFLGSIFGHIVSSVLGGEVGGTADFLAARRHIALATDVLTMPGLYLMLVSGAAMVWAGRINPLRRPWLLAHGALGLVILALALLVVVPAERAVLAGAEALSRGAGALAATRSAKATEDVVGAVNLLCAVAAMALAVWKPGERSRPVDDQVESSS